jgi:1-acyl-sn-glycerol-3-phosphate acyltransferase
LKTRKGESYLFVSNHRDIVLDTTLLNVALFEHGLVMTASAIYVRFLEYITKKMNRNFLVQRGLSPREMLHSSKNLSEYIGHLLARKPLCLIAQREGRTKDGNDITNPGVLNAAMGSDEANLMDYFKKIKVVPVSIHTIRSY